MRTYSEKQLVVLQSVIRLMEGGADLREVKASDIAQAAGIGKGSLYLYFSSKEDIILNALLYPAGYADGSGDRPGGAGGEFPGKVPGYLPFLPDPVGGGRLRLPGWR